MSDTPMGPEWWLASDGKWYPPTSQPGPTPRSSSSSRRSSAYRSSAWGKHPPWISPVLAGWLQGLMWATSALYLLTAALTINAYLVFEDFTEGATSFTTWSLAHDSYAVAFGLAVLLWIATYILLVVWSAKAHKVTERLDPGHRRWSWRWAVAGWFIPLAMLVIPKLVLNETEKIARAPRQDGLVSQDWPHEQPSPIGWAWWLLFIGGTVAMFMGSTAWDQTDLTAAQADIRTGYQFQIAGSILWAGSAACGALFVRRISRDLSPEVFESEVVYY